MDDTTEEMGKVLLLYPSIVNNIISHGRATELLGMENDVYDLAYDYGLEHDVTISVNIKNEEHFNDWLRALPYCKKMDGLPVTGRQRSRE